MTYNIFNIDFNNLDSVEDLRSVLAVYDDYLAEIDEGLRAINPRFNSTSKYIMGLSLSIEEVHELNLYFAYGRDKTFDEKVMWLDAWLKQLDWELPQEYIEKMVAAFDDPSDYVDILHQHR